MTSDLTCPRCGQPAPTAAALCAYCLLRAGSEFDYRTVTVLGHGEHGTVYLAEQMPGRRVVAIKIVDDGPDPEAILTRLENCRDALGRIGSPDAVRMIDLGLTDAGRPYIASEFVRGQPIDSYFRRTQADRRRRMSLVAPLRELLRALHASGIVHGGIKPSNVLVVHADGAPRARIMDFGLRSADRASDLAALADLTNDPGLR